MAKLQRKTATATTAVAPVIPAAGSLPTLKASFKLKPIKVSASEVRYLGSDERPFPMDRRLTSGELSIQFNWYSYICESSDSRQFLEQLVLSMPKRKHLVERYKNIQDWKISTTPGWLARLIMRGAHLPYSSLRFFVRTLRRIEEAYQAQTQVQARNGAVTKAQQEQVKAAQQLTIQDRMREKLGECIGEIDGKIDEFIANGCKGEVDAFGLFRQFNVHQNQVSEIANWVKPRLDELVELMSVIDKRKRTNSEEQLVEGYRHYSKRQVKALIEMWSKISEAANGYGQVKKAERAPRKRKPVPPEKQVRKIKYLKRDTESGLESIDPVKIVGASEIWVYNTKTRKLGIYIADDYSKVITVKGASLLGYSEKDSKQKTLRKPKEQLKQFTVLGKPAARKFMDNIKTSEIKMNGRFNEHTLILRAYK